MPSEDCPICFGSLGDMGEARPEDAPYHLPCAHAYHSICIQRAALAVQIARRSAAERGDDVPIFRCPKCRCDAMVVMDSLAEAVPPNSASALGAGALAPVLEVAEVGDATV